MSEKRAERGAGFELSGLMELARQMEGRYDAGEFFRGLLGVFGTSHTSVEQALAAAGNPDDRSVSHESHPALDRPDAGVKKRVYCRFVTADEDVREHSELLLKQPCVQDPQNEYRSLICVSPRQIVLRRAERAETLFFRMADLPAHISLLKGIRAAGRRGPRRAALRRTRGPAGG